MRRSVLILATCVGLTACGTPSGPNTTPVATRHVQWFCGGCNPIPLPGRGYPYPVQPPAVGMLPPVEEQPVQPPTEEQPAPEQPTQEQPAPEQTTEEQPSPQPTTAPPVAEQPTPAPAATPCNGATQPAPSAGPQQQEVTVTVKDFEFVPQRVVVAPGTTVTWKFQGPAPHTATSDVGASTTWDSGTQQAGGSYSVTFGTQGSFSYHCSIHDSMKGTVIVTPR